MSDYCQSVQDYLRASEALLQREELSDEETGAIEDMLDRLHDKLLNDVRGSIEGFYDDREKNSNFPRR